MDFSTAQKAHKLLEKRKAINKVLLTLDEKTLSRIELVLTDGKTIIVDEEMTIEIINRYRVKLIEVGREIKQL